MVNSKITPGMVKNKVYQEFINPTLHGEKDYIGIEIEIPILNLNKEAVDFNVVHQITDNFQKEFDSFKVNGIDYEGNTYSLKNKSSEDVICYDCSYNNIEFAMGKHEDLFIINERFSTYYNFIKKNFEDYGYTLTGMGINPYRKYNKEIPIPNERYLMLYHYLASYPEYKNCPMRFHKYPGYGMFSSASQVQLDVSYDNLVKTINVFSKIEPIKALLFSNSILLEENDDIICYRDALWEYSTHGINPHNIGMYDINFENVEELETYLESLNIYSVMRNGNYVNFPTMNLQDYFKQESVKGEFYNGHDYESIEIKPSLNDITYLRAFKFINLTFRGTVEFRSVCTQPIQDSMSVAAFHLGLKHNLDNLNELIETDNIIYHKGYTASELRKLLIKEDLPNFINKNDVYKLAKEVLDLSKKGLEKRGRGEEEFLKPLYKRVKNQTNPGKDMLKSIHNGIHLEKLIKEYGKLRGAI